MTVRELRGRRRHQLFGLVFLLVSAMFFATMIGIYQKAFTPVVTVTLNTDRAGNQMREGADVKARGVVVGEVRSVTSAQGHAALQLALKPEMALKIPADSSARLLPKTLFGDRYVALGFPAGGGSGTRLAEGAVIRQDRSEAAMEVEKVLNDLLPLLQAVQPQKLASTLDAVSQALDGRGAQLGGTIRDLDGYLARFNPSLPRLQSVVDRLDDVSRTYHEAAPDLLRALNDFTTTGKTVVEQRRQLEYLWNATHVTSVNASQFLEANQDNLIRLTSTSRPALELFGRYAPEYTCVLKQVAGSKPLAETSFGKGDRIPMQKVTIEIVGSRGKYVPGVDDPGHGDTRGPRCYPWVEPPGRFPQYPPGGPLQDGSSHPPPPHGPGVQHPASSPASTTSQSASSGPAAPLQANSPAERDLIAALLAPSLARAPRDVPQWSSVLVGPVYRGTEVTVR